MQKRTLSLKKKPQSKYKRKQSKYINKFRSKQRCVIMHGIHFGDGTDDFRDRNDLRFPEILEAVFTRPLTFTDHLECISDVQKGLFFLFPLSFFLFFPPELIFPFDQKENLSACHWFENKWTAIRLHFDWESKTLCYGIKPFPNTLSSEFVFRCVLASLYEALSVRRSVGPLVGPSVNRSVGP